jgi:hypothetical protein
VQPADKEQADIRKNLLEKPGTKQEAEWHHGKARKDRNAAGLTPCAAGNDEVPSRGGEQDQNPGREEQEGEAGGSSMAQPAWNAPEVVVIPRGNAERVVSHHGREIGSIRMAADRENAEVLRFDNGDSRV